MRNNCRRRTATADVQYRPNILSDARPTGGCQQCSALNEGPRAEQFYATPDPYHPGFYFDAIYQNRPYEDPEAGPLIYTCPSSKRFVIKISCGSQSSKYGPNISVTMMFPGGGGWSSSEPYLPKGDSTEFAFGFSPFQNYTAWSTSPWTSGDPPPTGITVPQGPGNTSINDATWRQCNYPSSVKIIPEF